MREKSAYKTAMVTLRIDQFENAGDLDFMLKNIVGREDYKRRFVMTEHTHETQKLVSRIEQHIEFSSETKEELLAQAYFNLGFVGYGLNHTLKAVNIMLDLYAQSPSKGKRIRLERSMNYLTKSDQYKKGVKEKANKQTKLTE